MNKEELYKLALSDVSKYSLLNEIYAIRDTRYENVDYTIYANGCISLDVLNRYVNLINQVEKLTQENNDLEERVIYQDNVIKQLQDKIKVYENSNDVTKMFMYCDEITQDTINKLNKLRGKDE